MTSLLHAYNTVEQAPAAPVKRVQLVDRDEYAAAHCPICAGSLWQRIRGLFCPRCRGWLGEECREGRVVYVLWQGNP